MRRWPRPRRARWWILAIVPLLPATLISTPAAGDDDDEEPFTDTSLPLTDSAVTVSGRGPFDGMSFTVNQTEGLTNQAISITWEGGEPTVAQGPKVFAANFVQIMQCWGDPDDLVPENPGPPPEKCVWGALNPTAASQLAGFATNLVTSRAFSHQDFADFDPNLGTIDESGEVFRDFVAVDGTVVTDHVDHTATGDFDQYWLNSYFSSVTSNEVSGVRTLDDGKGQALFTVDTGLERRGLGCGQRLELTAGREPETPRCWLVIMPRGEPELENEGQPFSPTQGVSTSPMRPASWQNRIAVELDFTPIDSPCDLASDQRRIAGNELPIRALSSWQPVLCTQPGRLPFAYSVQSDQLARRQVLDDSSGAPGMVAVNRPLAEGASREDDPVLYAPLTISAATIAFNVERVPSLDTPDDRLQRVRFARIDLTPRLVAKLLTQSYRSQVEIRSAVPAYQDLGSSERVPYTWHVDNPVHMLADPDFLQFNPEFRLWQSGSGKHAGGLILPSGTSDLASQVWEWILADPEATAWLAGEPDEFGMVVNPVYSTVGEANPTGIPFAGVPPDSFPKSDPFCHQEPDLDSGVTPLELCGIDWFPYAETLATAARSTARATDGAKTSLDRFAGDAKDAWKGSGAQSPGRRTMFGLTEVPSAMQHGLQTARLSRAGDNGADREFVAPDEGGLARAVASMTQEGDVLQLDPLEVGSGGYPLTALTYAAIRPLALDEQERDDFAAFLEYAVGPGQVQGFDQGQLPPGYAPLPAALAKTTETVAEEVRTLQPPEAPTTTTTTTTVVPGPSTGGPSSSPSPLGSGGGRPSGSGSPGGAAAPVPASSGDSGEVEIAAPVSSPTERGSTPFEALGNARFVLVVLAAVALLSALGSLEMRNGILRKLMTKTESS